MLGSISSAPPQLGAPGKRGQEAGTAPGRSPPAQPRLPPGPKGLPEGAKREPANGTPGTKTQKPIKKNPSDYKMRTTTSVTSGQVWACFCVSVLDAKPGCMRHHGGTTVGLRLRMTAAARAYSTDISPVCEWKLRDTSSQVDRNAPSDQAFLARRLGFRF